MSKDFSKIKRIDYELQFPGFVEHRTALFNIDDYSYEEIQKMIDNGDKYKGVIVCNTKDFDQIFRDVMNTDPNKI